MPSFDQIIALLTTYKYFFLLPISIMEGPVVSTIAGFLVSTGILNPFITYLILMAGDMLGDSIYYLIGRFGGRPFVRKWGRYFGLDENKLLRTEEHFKNHAKKTLFFGKTQAWGAVILAAAGLAKMPYPRYMWLNFLGSILKVFVFLLLGYYFGKAYTVLNQYMGLYTAISLVAIAMALTLYFILKRKRKHE